MFQKMHQVPMELKEQEVLVRGSEVELVMMGSMEQWVTEWLMQMTVEWSEWAIVDQTRMEVAASEANDQCLSDQCTADCTDDLIHQLTIHSQDEQGHHHQNKIESGM